MDADLDDHPLALTKAYLRTVAEFGTFVEVRSAQGTQDLPIFLRMLDKDTVWTYENGLPTLVTTLLQMNMVGYGFILPDLIGENGYNEMPTEELFIRWLQASVFMPSLQFSYVPWLYSNKTIEISRKYTELHAKFTDDIMKAFEKAVDKGDPVNPPIWWLDPTDDVAFGINDGTDIHFIEKKQTTFNIYTFNTKKSHFLTRYSLLFRLSFAQNFCWEHASWQHRFSRKVL